VALEHIQMRVLVAVWHDEALVGCGLRYAELLLTSDMTIADLKFYV
jgi:hypothetical protein